MDLNQDEGLPQGQPDPQAGAGRGPSAPVRATIEPAAAKSEIEAPPAKEEALEVIETEEEVKKRAAQGEKIVRGMCIGMCFGMAAGLSIGQLAFNQMLGGLAVGLAVGLCLGLLFGAQSSARDE